MWIEKRQDCVTGEFMGTMPGVAVACWWDTTPTFEEQRERHSQLETLVFAGLQLVIQGKIR
jgi:hypothetical protein